MNPRISPSQLEEVRGFFFFIQGLILVHFRDLLVSK